MKYGCGSAKSSLVSREFILVLECSSFIAKLKFLYEFPIFMAKVTPLGLKSHMDLKIISPGFFMGIFIGRSTPFSNKTKYEVLVVLCNDLVYRVLVSEHY